LELDSVDMKLLKILRDNGRATFKEMAEEVGLSTSGAIRRIRGLKEMGVIKGFTVEVDEEKLGYPVTALLNIETRPDKAPRVAEKLAEYEEVGEVNQMFRNPNVIAKVHAESVDRTEELKQELAKSRSVDGIDAKIVIKTIKGRARI